METKKIRLKTVNSTITCYICKGYLIDATTVTECLHTFCKSCLLKHLEDNFTCPKCLILIHQSHPTQYISYDRTMQDVVYKLVPNLYQDEMGRREEFCRKRGIPFDNPLTNGKEQEPTGSVLNKDDPRHSDFHRNDSQISLLLQCTSPTVNPLPKPYVCVSILATVTHLKKYIAHRLYKDIERFKEIDVLCNDELMGKDHNLDFIFRTRWRSKEPPLELQYRQHIEL